LLAHALLLAFGRTRRAAALTPAERQVLQLLGEGMTEGDTAQRLAIAEREVGISLCRALDKLAADGNRPPEALGAGVPRRPSPPILDARAFAEPDTEPTGA
ncbi:MAG: LuxR C-terminal-related transcriptional regulator, partial [Dehalococcoidia bacterium]